MGTNVLFGPAGQSETAQLRSSLLVVGAGYLFLTLCDCREGIANLVLRYLLKDDLRLTAAEMATFFAVMKIAWYSKPFACLFIEQIPLAGTRRKGYLVIFSLVAAVLWGALAFAPRSYAPIISLVLALNFALMIVQATLGGLLVELGQSFQATGRISAMRSGSESLGWLVTGLVAGLISINLGQSGFLLCAALMSILALLFIRSVNEPRLPAPSTSFVQQIPVQVRELFRHPTLWTSTGFWVLVKFSPGFGTPLFYHQSETLGFSPQIIGYLSFVSASAGLAGSAIYMKLCRRYALYRLIWIGVALHAAASLTYFAYQSTAAAFVIEATYGICTALALMPIFDLLARATPLKVAALGYAVIFSIGSISTSSSDLIGSWLYERLGHSFTAMIVLNSGTSALVLLAIPFLPRRLVAHRDGDAPTSGS